MWILYGGRAQVFKIERWSLECSKCGKNRSAVSSLQTTCTLGVSCWAAKEKKNFRREEIAFNQNWTFGVCGSAVQLKKATFRPFYLPKITYFLVNSVKKKYSQSNSLNRQCKNSIFFIIEKFKITASSAFNHLMGIVQIRDRCGLKSLKLNRI